MTQTPSPLCDAVRDFRLSWKTLAITDVVYKIIAFAILSTVVGIAFRMMLAFSGRTVLADEDIVYFLFEPAGWVSVIVVGALWLGVFALEQAALLWVLWRIHHGRQSGFVNALQFTLINARSILYLSARMMAIVLLAAVLLIAAVGMIYFTLLTRYDINYYLTEYPPEFLYALGFGSVVMITGTVALLRFVTDWFFALPLVLFEGVNPSLALSTSRERARGRRFLLLRWILGWALINLLLSIVITALVIWTGQLIVPGATGSLPLLAFMIGATLILWAGSNLVVNLLGSMTFSVMLFNLYRHYGSLQNLSRMEPELVPASGDKPGYQLTRTKVIIAALTGIILSIAVGAGTLYEVQLEDRTEIIAHRGASAAAPENSMAAVRQAIADKADWVEIDVQETAEGEVVVFHDSDFMKTANVDLKIWDATMADLEKIDIGGRFGSYFQDERVPTLRQVLAESKGKIQVLIELKYYGHDRQLEQRVADIVESEGMQGHVAVMSLSYDKVRKMKALRPAWKVGLLTSAALGSLTEVKADFLAVNARLANRDFVRSLHQTGKKVFVWTVNDAPTMSVMISQGVDGLITDDPALVGTVLNHRVNMNPAARLLLELAELLGVKPEIGLQ